MKRFLIATLLLTGCTQKDESPAPTHRQAVVTSIAQRVAIENFREMVRTSRLLADDSEAFCQNLGPEKLETVRRAWWNAHGTLKTTELIKFGPFVEYPLRIGPKLDDWPVNERAVEELTTDEGGLEQGDFDRMGTATRGFPVVEYLLWAKGADSLTSFMSSERRCAVLAGSAKDVHTSSSRLLEAWQTDWFRRLTQLRSGDGDEYNIVQHVIDEWVNRMAFTVENIRSTKLGKPLGDDAGGNPQPDVVESSYSGRSLQDARDALNGVAQVWRGPENSEQLGIVDLLTDQDAALIQRVDNFLTASASQLATIPEPLSTAIHDARDTIPPVQETLRSLQVAIQVELAQRLGVTVAFNDNDGD